MLVGLALALGSALGTSLAFLFKQRGAVLAPPVRARHPAMSSWPLRAQLHPAAQRERSPTRAALTHHRKRQANQRSATRLGLSASLGVSTPSSLVRDQRGNPGGLHEAHRRAVPSPRVGSRLAPGCGLVLPLHSGPTHAYVGASPACWAFHGRLPTAFRLTSAGDTVRRRRAPSLCWRDPPCPKGTLAVQTALSADGAENYAIAVEAWAADVWAAWQQHHSTIRGWLDVT
jgi:hypothetical protein